MSAIITAITLGFCIVLSAAAPMAAAILFSAALVIVGAYHFIKHFFGHWMGRKPVGRSHGARVSGGLILPPKPWPRRN